MVHDVKSKFYTIDNNELEVVLITLDNTTQILLSTQCLFINQNNTNVKIHGNDIESYTFSNVLGMSEDQASNFKSIEEYKVWLCSGDFRIIKKDDSYINVHLPDSDFGFFLIQAIKKLKFVTKKYTAI